jgi:cyclic beta-1,2-glucan glucanotransferase
MINPVTHSKSPEGIGIYMVEPYVVSADVYALPPLTGRGGWTWYTGSAGWMYRPIVESLLSLRLEVGKLRFAPCLPADWKAFKVHYRYRETVYEIDVLQPFTGKGETSMTVDGVPQPDGAIRLVDDRRNHSVEVVIRTDRGVSSTATPGRGPP